MKSIVLLCVVAAAFAAPPLGPDRRPQLQLESEFEISPDGNYAYKFSQDDGTSGQAKGEFHPGTGKDGDEGAVVVSGRFEWVGPDGVTYTATYTADENGYHPHYTQGQGGAIPDEVIKAFSRK